jgi:hypothetical protein
VGTLPKGRYLPEEQENGQRQASGPLIQDQPISARVDHLFIGRGNLG